MMADILVCINEEINSQVLKISALEAKGFTNKSRDIGIQAASSYQIRTIFRPRLGHPAPSLCLSGSYLESSIR